MSWAAKGVEREASPTVTRWFSALVGAVGLDSLYRVLSGSATFHYPISPHWAQEGIPFATILLFVAYALPVVGGALWFVRHRSANAWLLAGAVSFIATITHWMVRGDPDGLQPRFFTEWSTTLLTLLELALGLAFVWFVVRFGPRRQENLWSPVLYGALGWIAYLHASTPLSLVTLPETISSIPPEEAAGTVALYIADVGVFVLAIIALFDRRWATLPAWLLYAIAYGSGLVATLPFFTLEDQPFMQLVGGSQSLLVGWILSVGVMILLPIAYLKTAPEPLES